MENLKPLSNKLEAKGQTSSETTLNTTQSNDSNLSISSQMIQMIPRPDPETRRQHILKLAYKLNELEVKTPY